MEWKSLLESDNVISFTVRFTFLPRKKTQDAQYNTFRAAQAAARKADPEFPEET